MILYYQYKDGEISNVSVEDHKLNTMGVWVFNYFENNCHVWVDPQKFKKYLYETGDYVTYSNIQLEYFVNDWEEYLNKHRKDKLKRILK